MKSDNAPPIQYRVRLRPARHELAVTLTLAGEVARGDVRLEIPTWVPGDYSFAPQARDLFDLVARCGRTGEALLVRREGWQGFVVEGASGSVELTYTASAWGDDLAESAGLVDDRWAIVLGARYLRVHGYTGPCRVRYELPEGWDAHHPSGAARVGSDTAWDYPDYEILLDTPVVFGTFARLRRDVDGVPFWFVFVDRGVGFEEGSERLADAVAKTAEAFGATFGGFPFTDYTFVLSLNPDNDWGLEHLTSTMCGLGPTVFVTEDDFRTGVRVCAHELFHAWNVRRCRPAPLGDVQPRLQTGAFTDGLWVAEGFTRYYEFLACARAGVYTASQFFSNVVGYHRHLTVQPAYHRVSGADASYATYLNHAKYAGRVNNAIDYYDKGMLVAFGIDATLRASTEGSLDRAFAGFYRRFEGFGPNTPGYTTREVIDFFGEVYAPLRSLISAAVESPGGLHTVEQLRSVGFDVKVQPAPCLGLVFMDEVSPAVYGVLDDSPAGAAGLAPGDELVDIDGFAFSTAALTYVAGRTQPVTLSVRRGHRTLAFTLTPSPRDRIAALRWVGSAEQRARIAAWLGQEQVDLVDGGEIDLGFYENFHGIEVVV